MDSRSEALHPPAERLLLDSTAASAEKLSAAAVADIVRDASGPAAPREPRRDSVLELRGALDTVQRASLIARAEEALSCTTVKDARRDLKIELTEAEAHALVGRESVDTIIATGQQLLAGLGASADGSRVKLKLRRREAIVGSEYELIPFHRDYSLVVVNVALNDNFEGARLIFALGDRLTVPTRAAGDATAHDCTVVHAVSRLASGVRYNLYAVFEASHSAAA